MGMGISRFLPSGSSSSTTSGSSISASGAGGQSSGSESGDAANDASSRPDRELKCAHFILPHLAVVYPISSAAPPSSPGIREEKRGVEERERERRWRVVRGGSYPPLPPPSSYVLNSPCSPACASPRRDGVYNAASVVGYEGGITSARAEKDEKDGKENEKESEEDIWWSMQKVESFYKECCEGCEEEPVPEVIKAFQVSPRLIHCSASNAFLTRLKTN